MVTIEQLKEIGFQQFTQKEFWGTVAAGGKQVRVWNPGESDESWSVHGDGQYLHLKSPEDLLGLYKLLEVFQIPFSRIKTTSQKLVAWKWLPVRDGVFRTVEIDPATGARLLYQMSSDGDVLQVQGGASTVTLVDNTTPEEAQKIFLCLSGR